MKDYFMNDWLSSGVVKAIQVEYDNDALRTNAQSVYRGFSERKVATRKLHKMQKGTLGEVTSQGFHHGSGDILGECLQAIEFHHHTRHPCLPQERKTLPQSLTLSVA